MNSPESGQLSWRKVSVRVKVRGVSSRIAHFKITKAKHKHEECTPNNFYFIIYYKSFLFDTISIRFVNTGNHLKFLYSRVEYMTLCICILTLHLKFQHKMYIAGKNKYKELKENSKLPKYGSCWTDALHQVCKMLTYFIARINLFYTFSSGFSGSSRM